MTDGGFAKRSRITEYRLHRGGLGIKAMTLANEDRGGLVGAFIVEDGDEMLSITQNGQVVRSPINGDFRPTGRSTMGVKFVTPKGGDAVAVVARSVEADEDGRRGSAGEARGRRRPRWPDRRGGVQQSRATPHADATTRVSLHVRRTNRPAAETAG